MSMQVLQSQQQIADARQKLIRRGVSKLEPSLVSTLKRTASRVGMRLAPTIGDELKSWDVLKTIEFLEARVATSDPVLDIGSYASEIIVTLHRSGFTNLTGVDLNPHLKTMPFADHIRYLSADFMQSGLPDQSFSAITSISVIEHGFDAPRLMREVSRLLRPGGFFVASFDYWPDKIETSHVKFFGMDWLIFSRADVAALVEEAARHGLKPVGTLETDASAHAIHHGGFDYTFGWLALQKS